MKKLIFCFLCTLSIFAYAGIEEEIDGAINSYAVSFGGTLAPQEKRELRQILDTRVQEGDTCFNFSLGVKNAYLHYTWSAYEAVHKNVEINRAKEYPSLLSEAEIYEVVYRELREGSNKSEISQHLKDFKGWAGKLQSCLKSS